MVLETELEMVLAIQLGIQLVTRKEIELEIQLVLAWGT